MAVKYWRLMLELTLVILVHSLDLLDFSQIFGHRDHDMLFPDFTIS